MSCCSNYQKYQLFDSPTCMLQIRDENDNIKAEFFLKETTIVNQSDDQITFKSPTGSYTVKALGLVDHNDVSKTIAQLVWAFNNERSVCLDI